MTETRELLSAHRQDDSKLSEARLSEQLAQLRLITDGMPALVSYVDKERRYHFVNKTYTRWFGHTSEDIRGKYVWEVAYSGL